MILKGCALSCIMALMLACNAKTKEPVAEVIDKEQIKKEIQAKGSSQFLHVYNGGELKNIGYYADDATSFLPNRAPLVGKESIVAFLKSDLASPTNKIKFKTNEVFVSNDGSNVVEIGSFSVVDSANIPRNTGNYMSLFEKRNGKYVAVRDMSVSEMLTK